MFGLTLSRIKHFSHDNISQAMVSGIFKRLFLISLHLVLVSTLIQAQSIKPNKPVPRTTRILFVLDASGSMLSKWNGEKRIETAKRILSDLVDSLSTVPRVQVALRVYGHQFDYRIRKNCKDSKLEVGFGASNHNIIKQKLRSLTPQGVTPIAYSLEQATKDFPDNDPKFRNVIIMITDGLESCDGDPCAISRGLQRKGIFLRPFVIGMGLERDFAKAFSCMGRFINAQNPQQFKQALSSVMTQTLGRTTVTVELLDDSSRPRERDVNVSFINRATRKSDHTLIHYRDRAGLTDTVEVDPIPVYDMTVYTVPPVSLEDVEIIGGRHNTIKIKAPQGKIKIALPGYVEYSPDIKALIRRSGTSKTILAMPVAKPHDFLTGNFDIQVMTLPRRYFSKVKVNQGETTVVRMKRPGVLTILNKLEGFGSLYEVKRDRSEEWIYNIPEEKSSRLNIPIQPGRYKLVFRPKTATGSNFTKVRYFTIDEGGSVTIDIYSL